jgi:hypothetical protein
LQHFSFFCSKTLWLTKESLNSDGQKFHQYQQNDHSLQMIEHKKMLKNLMAD